MRGVRTTQPCNNPLHKAWRPSPVVMLLFSQTPNTGYGPPKQQPTFHFTECPSVLHRLWDTNRWKVWAFLGGKYYFPKLFFFFIFGHVDETSLFYISKSQANSKKQVLYRKGLKSFNNDTRLICYLAFVLPAKMDIHLFIHSFISVQWQVHSPLSSILISQKLWTLSVVLWQA